MCYFLAELSNKFINNIKKDIGFFLSTSETFSSAIKTLANTKLTIRRETIQK